MHKLSRQSIIVYIILIQLLKKLSVSVIVDKTEEEECSFIMFDV